MKTIFTTWCTDSYFEKMNCQKLINSAKYFHPDIPFFRFNKSPEELRNKFPHAFVGDMMAISCMDFIYDYDLVVHIDADSTITGTLDELLLGDFDIAGVRNNPDDPKALRRFTLGSIPANEFLNAGLVASTSKQFWIDWNNINAKHVHDFAGWENDTFNNIFHSGKYKTKILDAIEKDCFYGIANAWHISTDEARSTWASWQQAYIKNNKIFINSMGKTKQIKVLHQAGGQFYVEHIGPKQQYEKYFNKEVQEYLQIITS